MATKTVKDNCNIRRLMGDEEHRVLDVYYTDHNTKLFVENGVLVEQRIKSPSSRAPPYAHRLSVTSCNLPTHEGMVPLSSLPPPKPPQVNAENPLDHPQTIRTAKAALEYYNTKHNTKYEFVEPVLSSGSLWACGIWYHSTFKAKPETSSKTSKGGHGDSSTKLFFAELKVVKVESGITKYLVTACRPLDDTKTTLHCEMCGEGISHPTRGFRQGLYPFKRRALRPRRNGKVVLNKFELSLGSGLRTGPLQFN